MPAEEARHAEAHPVKFRVTIMANSLTGFWRYREMTVEALERKAVESVLRETLGREFRKLVHCSRGEETGVIKSINKG